MPALLGRIAGDDVALHAGRLELMHLQDLGNDAPLDARLRLLDQVGILDDVVLAALVGTILQRHGLSLDVAHEAGFLAAVLLVEADQVPAEFRLEHVGQEQHRRLQLEAGEPIRRRQLLDEREHGRMVAAIRFEREGRHHPHGRVENEPEAPGRDRPPRSAWYPRDRAIEPAHGAIEVPEEPHARHRVAHAVLGFVARIDAHAEEARALVVEMMTVLERGLDRLAARRIAGRHEEAEHDVAPGRGVEAHSSDCCRSAGGTRARDRQPRAGRIPGRQWSHS